MPEGEGRSLDAGGDRQPEEAGATGALSEDTRIWAIDE
jgi:hypothetical protein